MEFIHAPYRAKNSHLLLSWRHLLSSVIILVGGNTWDEHIYDRYQKPKLDHTFMAPVLIPMLRWMRLVLHFPILDVGFSKGHRINHDFHLHFQQPCLWPFGGCLIFSGTCNITHHAWQWRLNGRKKVGKCSHAGQTSSKSSVASNKVFANYLEIIIPHISHRGHHFEFLWSSFCRVWTHDIAQPLRNLRCLMEH